MFGSIKSLFLFLILTGVASCSGSQVPTAFEAQLDPNPRAVTDPENFRGSTVTLTGIVEKLPSHSSLIGSWTVDGKTILVRLRTQIISENGIQIGDTVEIKGRQKNSTAPIQAQVITELDQAAEIRVKRLVTGLRNPLYVTTPPNDASRLFIVEQKTGQIRIFNQATQTLLTTPFLTIPSADLLSSGFEQGLLGLAFHPDYAVNGKFYVNYTAPGGGSAGQTRLVEYQVSSDPNQAIPTPRILLTINQPAQNHNGGWIGFGPDDYLYWATGDGGGSGFQPGIPSFADNSRDITDNLLGKVLRLDVNGGDDYPADPLRNYRIPGDNPFAGKEGDDEIWVYGLRNPWRCSFDLTTGDLYIADVGQDSREEINVQPALSLGGENYGWNVKEGTRVLQPGLNSPTLVDPVYEYPHSEGASITGGYVYRGSNRLLQGTYFFADFISERIWSFKYTGSGITGLTERTQEFTPNQGSINSIASFGQDANGNLYVVDLGGEIFQVMIN
jgi:glucose/arabinose dehydrogenase